MPYREAVVMKIQGFFEFAVRSKLVGIQQLTNMLTTVIRSCLKFADWHSIFSVQAAIHSSSSITVRVPLLQSDLAYDLERAQSSRNIKLPLQHGFRLCTLQSRPLDRPRKEKATKRK